MAERYRRGKLMLLTGWTTQELDSVGAQDYMDVLQVYDADARIKAG